MKYANDYKSRFRILKGGLISLVVSINLYGAPSGGSVVSGSATINQNGTTTNINQSSNKAIINWQGFGIAKGESVNFNQPNSKAVALNRVIGNERSIIDGALNANGEVWLVNSNGVLFGKNARVSTAGIVASTKDISNEEFLNGNYNFKGNSNASIINEGEITLLAQTHATFIANSVTNSGTIEVHKGVINLIGASDVTLDLGDSVTYRVNRGVVDALVENNNLIVANGGSIYLTTNAKNELLRGVVNNSGIIEANSVDELSGEVILFAHGGSANISGSVEAKNGFVETSGKTLSVTDGAKITTGHWLIDPENITIGNAGTDVNDDGSTVNGMDGDVTVSASSIETALGSGSITLQADNDITVNEGITWTDNELTLNAGNDININANLVATADATLALWYDQADGGSGEYIVADGVDILIPKAEAFTWKKGSTGAINNLVFDNGNLRFGDGTEASINEMGLLLQPWYYDNVTSGRNDWYNLTFDSYPLDFMLGVGGSGYSDGDLYHTAYRGTLGSSTSNLSINIAKYFEKTGTIVVHTDVDTTAGVLPVTQTYTLEPDALFLKANTSIKNTTGSTINNTRIWVGTQDDYVAEEDWNYKTRGELTPDGFEAVVDQTSDSAKALIISEDKLDSENGAAVLFYSTTDGTNAIVGQRYNWDNIIDADISNMPDYSQSSSDGSYAIYLNLGSVNDGESGSVTWYYAAAPVSRLGDITSQVGGSAGVDPEPTPPVVEPTPPPVVRPTPPPPVVEPELPPVVVEPELPPVVEPTPPVVEPEQLPVEAQKVVEKIDQITQSSQVATQSYAQPTSYTQTSTTTSSATSSAIPVSQNMQTLALGDKIGLDIVNGGMKMPDSTNEDENN